MKGRDYVEEAREVENWDVALGLLVEAQAELWALRDAVTEQASQLDAAAVENANLRMVIAGIAAHGGGAVDG